MIYADSSSTTATNTAAAAIATTTTTTYYYYYTFYLSLIRSYGLYLFKIAYENECFFDI